MDIPVRLFRSGDFQPEILSSGIFRPEGAGSISQASVVTLQVIGQRSDNVGITQFQVRRNLVDPLGYEILAEVTNASDLPVECRFEIDLNLPRRFPSIPCR